MSSLHQKMDFLAESAISLHQYGVPAHRLESVIQGLARRLEIEEVQVMSIPTSIQIYIRTAKSSNQRMMRVRPGNLDIEKLQDADRIIESLARNQISLLDGRKQLIALREQNARYPRWLEIIAYALTSGAVALILLAPWSSAFAAALVGLPTGVAFLYLIESAKQAPTAEMVAAFLATILTYSLGLLFEDLEYSKVILASLIIPLPGLTLTTALMDLATEHLVAGTARMMGALMTLLKIFFGFVLGQSLFKLVFELPTEQILTQAPELQIIPGVAMATVALLILFRMKPQELPWVVLVCGLSFGVNRWLTSIGSTVIATLLAATAVAFVANVYARTRSKPASTLMLPGLILLVPGSIGYRSLMSMNQRDPLVGLDLAFQTLFVGLLIVAGILIGNFIISPKREL